MILTKRLRFVGREVQVPAPELGPNITKTIKVRILQQWWQSVHHPDEGEWRNVPLEEEA